MKKRPTLKTISEMTGFAVPTVSRALSDAPDIARATREQVQQVARDIGYTPNREGLRLKTGKTHTIALVIGVVDQVSDHSGRLIASVARALRDTPYNLVVTPFDNFADDPLERIKHVVENNLADAIIIEQIETEDARVRYLLDEKFPFATLGRGKWVDTCAFYDFDNHAFGRIAGETLLGKGCRSLMLIAPPDRQTYGKHIVAGLRKAMTDTNVTLELLGGIHSMQSRANMHRSLKARLESGNLPDGVICCSSNMGVQLLRAMRELGLRSGQDMHVFVKETVALVRDIEPSVSAMIEDVDAAGTFLAKAALHAIDQPDAPRMQLVAKPAYRAME